MGDFQIRAEDISLYSVLTDVIRNLWVIILAVLGIYMGISAYSKVMYTPQYQSTATLAVSARGGTSAYTSLNLASEMAGVFAEVFQSNILREKVADEMGMETLNGKVTTQVIPNTNLLRVSVVSDSPEESFRTLDLILDNYHLVSDYLFRNAVLEVVKEPTIPMGPCNSMPGVQKRKLYAYAGGGLVLLLIVVLSVLRDTIKTPAAARHKLDGAFMGLISHEVKNKTRRLKKIGKKAVLITDPLASFSFQEAYQSLCAKLDYRMRKKEQKVLVITSANENEGKSTVAANIALALAERKRKVLLVDCDFKKPAQHKIFEISREKRSLGFSDYISGKEESDGFFLKKISGLYMAVNYSGTKHSQKLIVSARMKQFLEAQKQQMDYIILDTPPMLVASDAEALAQLADVSLMVVRQDHTLAGDVNDCMDVLRRSASSFAGYVLNDYRELFSGQKEHSGEHREMSHRVSAEK